MSRARRIGFACIHLDVARRWRTCRRSTWLSGGIGAVGELALSNLETLRETLERCAAEGIRFYRMSSTMFPWWDGWLLEDAPQWQKMSPLIDECARIARERDIRCTFHPGHFCVPASANPKVVGASIVELELHAKFLDRMGLPRGRESKINIHMATAKPSKEEATRRFREAWSRMSDGVRSRLTLENDDSPGGWAVEDLLPISEELKIPIVFDSLHWRCHKGKLTYSEALSAAVSTWPKGVVPIVHHSSSRADEVAGAIRSAHSDWILEPFDDCGFEVDIMIEAKAKNRAARRYVEEYLIGMEERSV